MKAVFAYLNGYILISTIGKTKFVPIEKLLEKFSKFGEVDLQNPKNLCSKSLNNKHFNCSHLRHPQ